MEHTVWGIHAGVQGEADAIFRKKKMIAIGWSKVGDLKKVGVDREAFKEAVRQAYPETKDGAVPVYAGIFYRFVYEMKQGDVIVYPSKVDRHVHIGLVDGDYKYDPKISERYPSIRPIAWKRSVPRTDFSQGALYEIGSAVSLFAVRNYAEEFVAALEGKAISPAVKEDESVGIVVEEIEQTTKDYILKALSQTMKGHPLADLVANLLNTMGYKTRVSPPGPDGGVDIVAHPDELGFVQPIVKVQVKSSGSGSV